MSAFAVMLLSSADLIVLAVVESKFIDFLYTYVVFIPMPLRGKPKINWCAFIVGIAIHG